jgi:hypothetical protein
MKVSIQRIYIWPLKLKIRHFKLKVGLKNLKYKIVA